jgi:hypothetical protein
LVLVSKSGKMKSSRPESAVLVVVARISFPEVAASGAAVGSAGAAVGSTGAAVGS